MNMIEAITDWLAPVLGGVSPCLGEWDESPGEELTEFLSINLEGGMRPGPIARFSNVDLYYVSKRDQADMVGGKMAAFEKADDILQYIEAHPSSSCFVNAIPISGIIGPKTTEHHRLVFLINLEITR